MTGHDPAARTVEITTHEGESEELRYDQLVLALGSVSRLLPVPGLDEHAVGFKSLADAIWLRNHVIETLEAANASEDAERRERAADLRLRRRRLRRLEALAELQDFAVDAIERYPRAACTGMHWVLVEAADRVLPETDADLADYALRELRGRGIDVRLGTTDRGGDRVERARLSTGEVLPTRTRRLDRPASSPIRACASSACRSTSAGGFQSIDYLRVEGLDGGLGGRRLRRRPATPRGRASRR